MPTTNSATILHQYVRSFCSLSQSTLLVRRGVSHSQSSPELITLCAEGRLREALLEMAVRGLEMKFEGYDTILNACVERRATREGQRVQTHMIKTGYKPPVYLDTRLIVLYTKCGCLRDARKVFDEMPRRNVVSWTAVMSAYSQRGFCSEALDLFAQMIRSGILDFMW